MLLKAKFVQSRTGVAITLLNDNVPPDEQFFKKPTYFVYDLDDESFKEFLPARSFHKQYRYKFPEDPLDTQIERQDNA